MKKILTFMSLMFVLTTQAETVNFYVETTGDDTKDGLTAENALATVNSAIAYIHDDFAIGENNDYTINLGEGTFDAANIVINNDSLAFSLSLVGAGPDLTILTGDQDSVNVPNKWLFCQLKDDNSNINIGISELTISNYGFTTNNWGAIFFNENAKAENVNFSIDKCNIEKITSNLGGIYSSSSITTSFTLTNTYLNEVNTVCQHNRFHSPILVKAGKVVVNNCVFNNFKLNHNSSTQQVKTRWGSVLSAVNGKTNTSATEVTFINNTVVNDSIINGEKMSYDGGAIYIINATEIEVNPIISIANNIFVTGNQTFTGSTGTHKNYAIQILETSQPMDWLASTNNVMNSQTGFPEENNEIVDMYRFNSSQISFVMDGDLPEVLTAENGIKYVKATGSSIVAVGIGSLAPEYDIAGTERSETPTIGAYEVTDNDLITSLSETSRVAFGIYPNPVSSTLEVTGNITQLKIYSLAGQLIGSYQVMNKQVDVSALSQGMYIVNTFDNNGTIATTGRLLKK